MPLLPASAPCALRVAALALAGLAPAGLATAQEAPATLPRIELRLGAQALQVEVARTPAQRQRGLMGRARLAESDAMLFVFAEPVRQCFWMRDTLVALSAAFIADDGEIVDIADMAPRTDTPHCPSRPVRYVLEVNRGWFATRGIAAGATVLGEPFTR